MRTAFTFAVMFLTASSAFAQLQFKELASRRVPTVNDHTASVALGDVDGDGDLDLIWGNGAYPSTTAQNRLYLNDGTGTFTDATASRMPTDYDAIYAVALADVDGDGDSDLVLGNQVGQNRLYLNDGDGTFTDASASRMPTDSDTTYAVALGDVDGDGDLDLVLGNWQQQNRLYLNDGTGTFTDATAARMPTIGAKTTAMALGDVDGDGDPDLVLGNYRHPSRLYLNDGTGTFTDATASRIPTHYDPTYAVALGDVDGDGDSDLVFGNDFRQNRLYLNDGTGTFTDATTTRMPTDIDRTNVVVLGDVDGDGDPDLIFGNQPAPSGSTGRNQLYLNDGTGTFTDATASRMPIDRDITSALALGDMDGDGDPDLVFSGGSLNTRFYLNDGTGTFTDATAPRMPTVFFSYTQSMALGDVDGDGDSDLVLGNTSQNQLYMNLLRHLDSPSTVTIGGNYQLDIYARYSPAGSVTATVPLISGAKAQGPTPFGALGLNPLQMLARPTVVIPQPAGIYSITLPVPNRPSLVGGVRCAQALVRTSSPATLRFTNVTVDTIR